MTIAQPTSDVKLCECGCGQPTKIATYNCRRDDIVKGRAMRFLRGHNQAADPAIQAKLQAENARRRADLRERRLRLIDLYQEDATFEQIATELGTTTECVNSDVVRLRREGVLSYRCEPTSNYVTPEMADEVRKMWLERAPQREIAERFGWTMIQTTTVLQALRAVGWQLPHRRGNPRLPDRDEQRKIIRNYKRRASGAVLRSDAQRVIVRLLQAAARPLRSDELYVVYVRLTGGKSRRSLYSLLDRLRASDAIERVRTPDRTGGEGWWLYFVPFGGERSAETLTLADAERETELAALIGEQEREAARGEWADTDFRTTSLDAERGANGVTLYEFLEDEA